MVCSETTSIFAVASSSITSLLFLKIALQMHMSYLSPTLRFAPFSSITKSKPVSPLLCFYVSMFVRPAYVTIESIFSSATVLEGSKLYLNVPANRTGSYGITVSLSLRYSSERDEISTSSMTILPFSSSIIRAIARPNVDLPAPVLPTIPTFFPASISKEIPCNTRSVFYLYLK